jgi:hypothetical protein
MQADMLRSVGPESARSTSKTPTREQDPEVEECPAQRTFQPHIRRRSSQVAEDPEEICFGTGLPPVV